MQNTQCVSKSGTEWLSTSICKAICCAAWPGSRKQTLYGVLLIREIIGRIWDTYTGWCVWMYTSPEDVFHTRRHVSCLLSKGLQWKGCGDSRAWNGQWHMKSHPQQEMRLEGKVNILYGGSITDWRGLAQRHREAHRYNKRGAASVKGVREPY